MANISNWSIVGISKKCSSEKPDSNFYEVSMLRENDSLSAGKIESRCIIVSEKVFDEVIEEYKKIVVDVLMDYHHLNS